jgi:MYXO-CTERM domain-containing protein
MTAEVAWPDLDDASPTVTQTAAGLVVSSDHGFAVPGYYDVPVTVQLAGQAAPVAAVAHVVVANLDGTPPSPVLLAPPSAEAIIGVPYEPNGAGALSRALVVGGNGPFAFGAATPVSVGMTVDDAGRVIWTPSRSQLGRTRLAVRIVDADGAETVVDWVVEVGGGKSGGCAVGGPGAGSPSAMLSLLLLVVGLLLVARRSRA